MGIKFSQGGITIISYEHSVGFCPDETPDTPVVRLAAIDSNVEVCIRVKEIHQVIDMLKKIKSKVDALENTK